MRLGDEWTVSGCESLSNGQAGIQIGSGSTIRDCAAYATRGIGIIAGGACVLSGCAAARNGTGISAGTGCDVSDCTASGNTTNGFSVGAGSSVIGCTAATNGRDGVYAGNGCTVRACAASDNGRDGISVSNHSRVAECVAFRNQGDGIEVTANTLVDGNNCVHNLGIGIRVVSVGNRIQGNQVEDNAFVGILCMLTTNNALVVRNNASGSGITNYVFAAGTYDAQPLTPTQDFVTDQPWANFDYPTAVTQTLRGAATGPR
jgi:parallel beta-helix repeat protein